MLSTSRKASLYVLRACAPFTLMPSVSVFNRLRYVSDAISSCVITLSAVLPQREASAVMESLFINI